MLRPLTTFIDTLEAEVYNRFFNAVIHLSRTSQESTRQDLEGLFIDLQPGMRKTHTKMREFQGKIRTFLSPENLSDANIGHLCSYLDKAHAMYQEWQHTGAVSPDSVSGRDEEARRYGAVIFEAALAAIENGTDECYSALQAACHQYFKYLHSFQADGTISDRCCYNVQQQIKGSIYILLCSIFRRETQRRARGIRQIQ